jgi:hypothetical protein
MTMTIQGAVTAIAAKIATVTGVGAAPSNPQENINERVFALVYCMSNTVEISEIGTKQNLANIAADVLTPLTNLEQATSTLTALIDPISTAMIEEMSSGGDAFGGAIDTFSFLLVEFIPFYPYSGVDCIAYRFTLQNVKQKINL